MQNSDIVFFKSNQPGSTGGTQIAAQVLENGVDNLFAEVSRQQYTDGLSSSAKVFVANTHPTDTLTAAAIWVLIQPADDSMISVGLGTPTDTDDSAVVYAQPTSLLPVVLGDLAPGASQAIWVNRDVAPASPPPETGNRSFFQTVITGSAGALTKLTAFIWGLSSLTPESEMGSISYDLQIQIVDRDQNIITQEEVQNSVALPSDTSSDLRVQIQANQVDQPLNLPSAYVDFIYVKGDPGQQVTFKLGGVSQTAFTLNQKGVFMLDGQNITGVNVSNVGSQAAELRVIMARRQS